MGLLSDFLSGRDRSYSSAIASQLFRIAPYQKSLGGVGVKDKSKAEQIRSRFLYEASYKKADLMIQCLLVNDYLKTISKSLAADGHNIDEFIDHYSDLIEMIISINWHNHETAEAISRDDFRRNLKSH